MRFKLFFTIALAAILFQSCQKEISDSGDDAGTAKINFIFKFDSTQARLNNLGQPATMPASNAGQSPRFNSMSAHYVELTKDEFTALGAGAVLYTAPEVTTGGARAIDFSKAKLAGDNELFLSVPVKNLPAGTYNWLRVSLAYQNYDVTVSKEGFTAAATVASFIGF